MRRVRRRAVEFAARRGIVISRVPIGIDKHRHPCNCVACSTCTCIECVSFARDMACRRPSQASDPAHAPCYCGGLLSEAVCPVCEAHGAFCYHEGVFGCYRCASIFPATHPTSCMSMRLASIVQSDVEQAQQAVGKELATLNKEAERQALPGGLRQSSSLGTALRVRFQSDAPSDTDDSEIITESITGTDRAVEWPVLPSLRQCSSIECSSDSDSFTARDLSRHRIKCRFRKLTRLLGGKPRPLSYVCDDVQRRENVLRNEHCEDQELLWRLRSDASLRERDATLPDLLKRKAEAWLRANRTGISERQRHMLMSRAIPNAMLDNAIDRNMRTMLRRQDPMQMLVFNKFVNGYVVPPRSGTNRFVKWLGFKKYADKMWLKTAKQVLPSKI